MRTSGVLLITGLFAAMPAVATAATAQSQFIRSLDRMMVQLGPESARDARAIKNAYKEHLDLLVLERYDELQGALFTGGLAPLPHDPLRFNLAPRLSGPSPTARRIFPTRRATSRRARPRSARSSRSRRA